MTRYIPAILGLLLIVGLTIPQVVMTDRLSGTNVSAEQRAELLKLVPMNFGDWHGEDKPVDPRVRKVAGAIGAVSRDYRNARTGEKVELWLIVGHARDVSYHTPDVCYPGSGFEARASANSLYPLVVQGLPETPFWTNTFFKEDELSGRRLIRVFWSWFNPEAESNGGKIVWDAPPNPRWHFGNTRALYKMYFTSEMRDPMETAEQSACLHFARDFLPEADKALTEVHAKMHPGETAKASAGETPAAAAPAAEAPPSESPKAAPAAEDKGAAPATDSPAAAEPETPKADK